MIETEATGAIIERAIAGDEVAFARIIADHHEDMARIAYLVSGSLDLAEDAVQAAWAIAWRRLGTLRDPARLRPWLMSEAANEARQMADPAAAEPCASWPSAVQPARPVPTRQS